MPLKTPSPAKSSGKSAGKVVTPARGKDKAASTPKKKAAVPLQPEPVRVRWWDTLSDERKLDMVGAIMALVGLMTALILFSAQRSAVTGSMLRLLSQMVGWGIYVLPFGLIVMGLWLILRRIEKLPPLSLERATGFILFFLWLLAVLHTIIATPEMADIAALDGAGGGFVGAFFEKGMLNNFGAGGTVILLLAWLLITTTMILDISVEDLFKWFTPVTVWVREALAKRRAHRAKPAFSPENSEVASDGYTPLNRSEPVVTKALLGKPVTTVKTAETVIQISRQFSIRAQRLP
jgi:S-DNA-T family DNA segregation ATPase FtsK/SpoIIIE